MKSHRFTSRITVFAGVLGMALLVGMAGIVDTVDARPNKKERVVTKQRKADRKVVRQGARQETRREARRETRREVRREVRQETRQERRLEPTHRTQDRRVIRHPRAHNRRVIRNHRHADRYVVRHHRTPVRIIRPWARSARYVTIGSSPFYFHAGLGIYLGGASLYIDIGDDLPYGYAYFDPYCDEEFYAVDAYHRHLRHHRHRPALRLVRVEVCGY